MAERSNRSRADFFAEFGGPHSVGFQHGTFVVVAAELVYSGFERFVMPLRDAQCLHSPAFAVSLLDAGIVVRDAPIRADDAVVSVSVPQQIGDDIFAKTVADLFSRGVHPVGNRIIGHDGCGLSCLAVEAESSFHKGPDVLLEISAGVNSVFPEAEMGIPSAFFRAAARPMFDHGIDAFIPPAVRNLGSSDGGLESVDIGPRHIGVQIGVFAEGTVEPVPPGFGRQIDLRRQRCGDTQGAVFGGCDPSELFDQFGVERSGQPERTGPQRNLSS